MKKNIFKTPVLFSIIGFLSVLSFISCDGVIFSEIRNEVELDEAEIYGSINSIVRYYYDGEETAFLTNEKIHYRSISTTENTVGIPVEDIKDANGNVTTTQFDQSAANQKMSWTSFPSPDGRVYGLAADSKYLYAVVTLISKDDEGYNSPTGRALYCFDPDSGEWTKIYTFAYSKSVVGKLFCTNAPQAAHRHAYFRHGTSVWELSGTNPLVSGDEGNTMEETITTLPTGKTLADIDNQPTPTYATLSCAYFDGTVYFSSSSTMITNETLSEDATHLYYSSGHVVYYTTADSTWASVDLGCDSIQSLAITSDYIIAGTSGGIAHSKWASEGVPTKGTSSFSTNASSTLSSYYEVPQILVVDPSLSETAGTIYAASESSKSSASIKNIGLWGYYKSKGKWNRE